jgi:hypothetical protein
MENHEVFQKSTMKLIFLPLDGVGRWGKKGKLHTFRPSQFSNQRWHYGIQMKMNK